MVPSRGMSLAGRRLGAAAAAAASQPPRGAGGGGQRAVAAVAASRTERWNSDSLLPSSCRQLNAASSQAAGPRSSCPPAQENRSLLRGFSARQAPSLGPQVAPFPSSSSSIAAAARSGRPLRPAPPMPPGAGCTAWPAAARRPFGAGAAASSERAAREEPEDQGRGGAERDEAAAQPAVASASSSAAGASASAPKASSSRVQRDRDPIVVTARAADRIKELLAGEGAAGAVGIRLGVRRRGCNGLSYTLNYAYPDPESKEHVAGGGGGSAGEEANPKRKKRRGGAGGGDVEVVAHGVRVRIDPMALFSIVGTTMDWEENELASEFTFKNPNSKGECGCGESFTV